MEKYTCCFIGHRQVKHEEEVRKKIAEITEMLVRERGIRTFYFGSRSRFDDLCYEAVTELRSRHPDICRVYVRAEFPEISEQYESYLLQRFEETVFPDCVRRAGRAAYIKRNRYMMDLSEICVFYCCEAETEPSKRTKSGTRIALAYAETHNVEILRICE